MIKPVDNVICGPLNFNKSNINNILLKNIDYSSEIMPDGFVSRNLNLVKNQNNKPSYSQIINDCQKRVSFESDKYKEIILDKHEPGEDENEETLEKLITNMENKIKSINNKIIETYKNTVILDQSLPEQYSQKQMLSEEDQNILKKLNEFLKFFSENEYTKDDL